MAWGGGIIRYMAKYRSVVKDVTGVFKALGDENRARVLMVLMGSGELCVCQITELLGLAASTVSKHLSILAQAGLIESRKKGRWVHYRCAEEKEGSVVSGAQVFLWNSLIEDSQVAEDVAVLKRILKENPEELCQRQRVK